MARSTASPYTIVSFATRNGFWPMSCAVTAKPTSMRTESNGATAHVADPAPDPAPAPDFSDFMQGLVRDAKGYLHAEREHLVMQATEKAAVLLSRVVRSTVMVVMLAASFLFLNLALALYLGELLRSQPLGFLIVAGFHLLLLGGFMLWWSQGGRDRFMIDRINDLDNDED